MNIHVDKQFVLSTGLDAYSPALIADILKFFTLNNVDPRLNRLFATRGYQIFQNLNLVGGEKVISIGFYQLSNRRFVNLYAFTQTSIYWFDFSINQFQASPIYSGFMDNEFKYVILPWYDALYVTKFGDVYVKIERKDVTIIPNVPGARYGIVANSHVYLGAVSEEVTAQLARLRWSDRNDPESFLVSPSVSEADFFDLEPDSRQLTGLSFQRGSPIDYAENAIWIGTDIGFPGGFRHEPLFPGLGNIFHDSVVRCKEIDYFIGPDNFYALNGLQVVPIGDEIYQRFINDILVTSDTSVPGFADTRNNCIFWIYTRNSGEKRSVVYNYVEKKWSERDPQDINTFFDSPRVSLRGYDVIDDIDTIINDDSDLIDDPDAGYPIIFPQLVGSTLIGKSATKFTKLSGGYFDHTVETFDFYFDNFKDKKEFVRVDLDVKKVGDIQIFLSIGTRNNQSDDITWSDAKNYNLQDGSFAYFIRSESVGKHVRFRFTWQNQADKYVDELLLLSLTKVDQAPEDAPEK